MVQEKNAQGSPNQEEEKMYPGLAVVFEEQRALVARPVLGSGLSMVVPGLAGDLDLSTSPLTWWLEDSRQPTRPCLVLEQLVRMTGRVHRPISVLLLLLVLLGQVLGHLVQFHKTQWMAVRQLHVLAESRAGAGQVLLQVYRDCEQEEKIVIITNVLGYLSP